MSCLCCCTLSRPRKVSEHPGVVKPNVVAINTRDSDGVQEQGTGILISDHLVLTSHIGLPSLESARDGQIALRNMGASNRLPNRWSSSSTILTRKLLPQRLFVTSPGLGLTIVACEAINSNTCPTNYEVPKAAEEGLKLGCSVYVLGQVQQDDREGLLMFGQGLVSREDEHVIEFYSLDGYVWAPGSTGFDANGTFAFVVGDSRPDQKVTYPLRRRWTYALSKGPSSTQPGILIHGVHDWTRDIWNGEFYTLMQLCNSASTSGDAPSARRQNAGEAKVTERGEVLGQNNGEIQNTRKDGTAATIPRSTTIRSNLQDYGKNSYRATDSHSTVTSVRIMDIPVQASFLPIPALVPYSSVDDEALVLKPQSLPKLGGIAALAVEELGRYDERSERFTEIEATGNQMNNSPVRDRVDRSSEVEFHDERKLASTCQSPQDELKSSQSHGFSSWWKNLRPTSPQRRGQSLPIVVAHSLVANETAKVDMGKSDEDMTDCLEPNSPPRRFLMRGAYTAAPRRELCAPQTNSNVPNLRTTKTASPNDNSSPLYNMIKPSSPSTTERPRGSTVQASSMPLSPEIPYLKIHQTPSNGCLRQSNGPWKPPGELDSRRILPSDPPRQLTTVVRTRTHPRDYSSPRSKEEEQKKLTETTGQKVSAGMGTYSEREECSTQPSFTIGSQDGIASNEILVSPQERCGENDMLETSCCTCPLELTTSQDMQEHDVSEVNHMISPDYIQQISTPRLTLEKKPQRVTKCTCFQKWRQFVTQKKKIVIESMRSLFSPRTVPISVANPWSISSSSPIIGSPPQSTYTTHELVDSEPLSDDIAVLSSDGTTAADAWFVGSPLSNHNGSRSAKVHTLKASTIIQQQQPSKEPQDSNIRRNDEPSSQTQMLNWTTKQQRKMQGETIDDFISEKQACGGRGQESTSATTEAVAQVKIWNGCCIASLNQQDVTGAAQDPSPSKSEVISSSQTEKYVMTASRKEKSDQRKEIHDRRPRWSIARINKGPLNIGHVIDPLDDLTKNKSRTKKQPQPINTGVLRATVSQEECTMMAKKNSGVRALTDQKEMSMFMIRDRDVGQMKAPSLSREPALNMNCKAKIPSKKPASTERSKSPSRPTSSSSSKRPLETPGGPRGSSASSSSSDKEGRPRWRCP